VPRVRIYDAALVTWAVLWIAIGVLVARDVTSLTQLSDTVVTSATALEQTSKALTTVQKTIDDIPFVPEIKDIEKVRRAVARTARQARRSGRESKKHVERLSYLLGVSIAVAPTLPVLAVYLPLRRTWRKGRR
jgi:hypothetical protein